MLGPQITKVADKWRCAAQCDRHPKCMFFFYTINKCCALYSSCKQQTMTDASGKTFAASFKPYIEDDKRTCNPRFMIGKPTEGNMNMRKCVKQCDEDNECMFFFYSVDKCCAFFKSCSQLGEINKIGTTFKIGISNGSLIRHFIKET